MKKEYEDILSEKKEVIDFLKSKLKTAFEKQLFEAAIGNLQDTLNPLRFNNFAYALRELIGYILRRLAPENEVKSCIWFEPEKKGRENPTRRQRIKYAIHGGVTENGAKVIGLDTKEIEKRILANIETLNGYVHVKEDTFNVEYEKQNLHVVETLETVQDLFKFIDNFKDKIYHWFNNYAYESGEIINESVNQMICLASRIYIDYLDIEEVFLEDIDDCHVSVSIEGTVSGELQYGSDSDMRNDNGLITPATFPFSCIMKCSVENPKDFELEDIEVNTDRY